MSASTRLRDKAAPKPGDKWLCTDGAETIDSWQVPAVIVAVLVISLVLMSPVIDALASGPCSAVERGDVFGLQTAKQCACESGETMTYYPATNNYRCVLDAAAKEQP